jgi:hypothetical protein
MERSNPAVLVDINQHLHYIHFNYKFQRGNEQRHISDYACPDIWINIFPFYKTQPI